MNVGIDLVTISRFKNHERLSRKILSKEEYQEYLLSADKMQYVASRFCLKEAFLKSIKKGVLDIDLKEIIIVKEECGAIHISYCGQNYDCSLSHELDKCVGVVIYD